MEPCSKRPRDGGSSGEDRLSALPDDLLHAILSSVKARQVVQTSVLSRRWRSLWRSVPCLDVDEDDFRISPMSRKDIGDKFEDFVDFLLLGRGGSVLDTFRLCACESFAGHRHAGSMGPILPGFGKRDAILVKASISYWSPDEEAAIQETQRKLVSNVGNVTTLELSDFLQIMVPDMEPVEFPTFQNLRNLLLDRCDLRDDFQLLRYFLQKSPNLEKLTVRCCWLPEGFAGVEGMAKLKKLKSTEIIYEDYHDIRGLVCFMLEISDCVPKNTIRLTKV
ncbi:unnamed protein product [Urochloa humidicola]